MRPSRNSRKSRMITPRTRAFTLIEMMIVTVIMAILAIGLLFAFQGTKDKADFSNQQIQVVNLIQEARGLSLSNLMVESGGTDYVAEYYKLEIAPAAVSLTAHADTDEDGIADASVEIGEVTFEGDVFVRLSTIFDAYYYPPYGDVCIDDCSTGPTQDTFTLTDGVNETDITITIYGGYPEVEE